MSNDQMLARRTVSRLNPAQIQNDDMVWLARNKVEAVKFESSQVDRLYLLSS